MKLFFLLTAIVFCFSFLQASETEVTIKVDNIPIAEGNIRIGLFDTEEAFRDKKYLENSPVIEVTEKGSLSTTIKLKPGTYAIGVVHDLNKNGQLDVSKGFKIPVEPLGFSNNPKIMFGPPKYSQCLVEVTEEAFEVKIVLKTK